VFNILSALIFYFIYDKIIAFTQKRLNLRKCMIVNDLRPNK